MLLEITAYMMAELDGHRADVLGEVSERQLAEPLLGGQELGHLSSKQRRRDSSRCDGELIHGLRAEWA